MLKKDTMNLMFQNQPHSPVKPVPNSLREGSNQKFTDNRKLNRIFGIEEGNRNAEK